MPSGLSKTPTVILYKLNSGFICFHIGCYKHQRGPMHFEFVSMNSDHRPYKCQGGHLRVSCAAFLARANAKTFTPGDRGASRKQGLALKTRANRIGRTSPQNQNCRTSRAIATFVHGQSQNESHGEWQVSLRVSRRLSRRLSRRVSWQVSRQDSRRVSR